MCNLFCSSCLPETLNVYVQEEGRRLRRGIGCKSEYSSLDHKPLEGRTFVGHANPYNLCRCALPQYILDGFVGDGWSLHLRTNRGLSWVPTVAAQRRSHSYTLPHFSDPTNQKPHHLWEVWYLIQTFISTTEPTITTTCSYWKLSQFSPGQHGKERKGFRPIGRSCVPRQLPWLLEVISDFVSKCSGNFNKRAERGRA